MLELELLSRSACYLMITVAAPVSVQSDSTGDCTSTWWDSGEDGGGGCGGVGVCVWGVGGCTSCVRTHVSVAAEHAGEKRG